METKGNTLKRLRKENGLSQTEVGLLCNMNKSQISKLENDKINDARLYEKVFNLFGYKTTNTLTQIKFPYEQEEIIAILKKFKKENKDVYGIETLGLYGSCARNEQGAESDIDIAVRLKSPNLLKMISLEDKIQDMFKVKADIISLTSKFLPGFLEEITKDIIYV